MHTSKLTSDGTITIPLELLQKLGLRVGDELIWEEHEGNIVLAAKLTRMRRAQTQFQSLFAVEPGRSLVDELLEDRRQDAAKEEMEFQNEQAKHSSGD